VDAFLYGSLCSDRAFGHAGAQSSVGFCDPEYGFVVAMALNGMPGPTQHNQRMLDLANAIHLAIQGYKVCRKRSRRIHHYCIAQTR
jgi:hypothetical protein